MIHMEFFLGKAQHCWLVVAMLRSRQKAEEVAAMVEASASWIGRAYDV
jgi:hypothetical protein